MGNDEQTDELVATQRELYDRRYATEIRLDVEIFPLDFLDVRLRRAWRLLPVAPTILDLGCGSGRLLLRQRPVGSFFYVGTDISQTGLVRANETVTATYPDCGFVQSLAGDLPFCNSTFDAVFAISVIEHLPDPERFVDDCARVLKANGLLVLHTPNPEDLLTIDGFLRRFFPELYVCRGHAVGHDYGRFLSPKILSQMMGQRELRVVRLEYTDTLLEWLWVNIVWPAILSLARKSASLVAEAGANVNEPHPVQSGAMNRVIRLYNSVIFPLVRLMCWPDRLIELTGHSGGYIVIARKGK